jgi:triacylglycerol lipase
VLRSAGGPTWIVVALTVLITVFSGLTAARADADDPYYNDDECTEFYTPPEPLPQGRTG